MNTSAAYLEGRGMVLADYFMRVFFINRKLTSSWNWISRIAQKKYHYFLMLSGSQGFDYDFKEI